MVTTPSAVALIPARLGSKRVPGKNTRHLAGHPLLAYSIAAAQQSGCFGSRVYVSTDSEDTAALAERYGARSILRPAVCAQDESPDLLWVQHALDALSGSLLWHDYEVFSILRPTSPFRSAATIQRAWAEFLAREDVDSLRAVEPVRQHPGKVWRLVQDMDGRRLAVPIWAEFDLLTGRPSFSHSQPTQTLEPLYVQNASLEIAWTWVVAETDTISGYRVLPFLTEGYEGFDLNTTDDWLLAEVLVERGLARLPEVALEQSV